MNPEQVLRKSAKGREEIEKRTHRIDSRRRTLLILIDGQSSVAELADKCGHLGDPIALLGTLLAEGFIEPADGSAPAEASPAQALPGNLSLEQLKRAATREIERLMGPDGDALAMRIEQVDSTEQFLLEAQRTREALAAFLGPRKAEAFWKALGL